MSKTIQTNPQHLGPGPGPGPGLRPCFPGNRAERASSIQPNPQAEPKYQQNDQARARVASGQGQARVRPGSGDSERTDVHLARITTRRARYAHVENARPGTKIDIKHKLNTHIP
jgi:hypothetical protein